jgi:seryl-tRNA synthetase
MSQTRSFTVKLASVVSRDVQDDIIKNLYWLDPNLQRISFDPAAQDVLLVTYAGSQDDAALQRRMADLADDTMQAQRKVPSKVYYRSPGALPDGACAGASIDSVYEQLVQRGWVKPAGEGIHIYTGLMYGLFNALDTLFLEAARSLGVQEHKFPTLLPIEDLHTCGYLQGFPHNANFVCHLPEQLEKVEAFKAQLTQGNAPLPDAVRSHVAAPEFSLSPTVCYHYYRAHRDARLEGTLIGATAMSSCYRNEGRATGSLRRLCEFNMREIIFLGAKQAVIEKRDALLQVQQRMLERLRLDALIHTASDPFFIGAYEKQRLFQAAFDLKYEVKAYLPLEHDWFAVGSVNFHQDHFGKAFNIRLPDGELAQSCCLGFGIDRWCFAVFAQHGIDKTAWPRVIAELV